MDQNTFNFWYNEYVKYSGGYPPLSLPSLQYFIQTNFKYYNQYQPQYFIPIQNNQIPTYPSQVAINYQQNVSTNDTQINVANENQNIEVKTPDNIDGTTLFSRNRVLASTSVDGTPKKISEFSQENSDVNIKMSEKTNIPKVIFNKKYGLKNKEDCSNGMSCKNIYCTLFHHPSADPNIFYEKK